MFPFRNPPCLPWRTAFTLSTTSAALTHLLILCSSSLTRLDNAHCLALAFCTCFVLCHCCAFILVHCLLNLGRGKKTKHDNGCVWSGHVNPFLSTFSPERFYSWIRWSFWRVRGGCEFSTFSVFCCALNFLILKSLLVVRYTDDCHIISLKLCIGFKSLTDLNKVVLKTLLGVNQSMENRVHIGVCGIVIQCIHVNVWLRKCVAGAMLVNPYLGYSHNWWNYKPKTETKNCKDKDTIMRLWKGRKLWTISFRKHFMNIHWNFMVW